MSKKLKLIIYKLSFLIFIFYSFNSIAVENYPYFDPKKDGYNIQNPPKGITFNLPLNVMEDIFDFWLETYKNKNSWQTSLGLLKIKKRLSLSSIIKSKAIKSHVIDLACIIEKLHNYRPSTQEKYKYKDPMWK